MSTPEFTEEERAFREALVERTLAHRDQQPPLGVNFFDACCLLPAYRANDGILVHHSGCSILPANAITAWCTLAR